LPLEKTPHKAKPEFDLAIADDDG